MPLSSRLIEQLLTEPRGRIVAVNILRAFASDMIDRQHLSIILRTWQAAYSTTRPGSVDDLIKLLEDSCRVAGGSLAPPVPHIVCRRVLARTVSRVASVRMSSLLTYAIHPEDVGALERKGIRLAASAGTDEEGKTLTAARAQKQIAVRLNPAHDATITRPHVPHPVFWFTDSQRALAKIGSASAGEEGTTLRDALGLVHIPERTSKSAGGKATALPRDKGRILALIDLPSELVERRPDCGRPTFVEAGRNSRFKFEKADETLEPEWGATVDLKQLADGFPDITGLPERVCGQVPLNPPTPTKEPVIYLKLFAGPTDSRDDDASDQAFADILEAGARNAAAGHALRDQLLDLCKTVA